MGTETEAVDCPHEARGPRGHIQACLYCGDPTRVVCPRCGQEVSLYADGNLWKHGTQASSSPLGGRDSGCEGSMMFLRDGELWSRVELGGVVLRNTDGRSPGICITCKKQVDNRFPCGQCGVCGL